VAIGQGTTGDEGRNAWVPRASQWLRERLPLVRRAHLLESLDDGDVTDAELGLNLADLARLGRLPGGVSASIAGIRRIVPSEHELTVIDVGAGRGDMALAFASRGWRTVAVDSHADVLRVARATAKDPLVEVVSGDGRSLPFPDGAFDVSHCSLLLHHLGPPDAVESLREMARVARHGVVVNDLRRGVIPFVATGVAVALLARCRTTRVDGLASVRRAYTLPELDELLAKADLEVRWRSPAFMPRVVTAAVRRTQR